MFNSTKHLMVAAVVTGASAMASAAVPTTSLELWVDAGAGVTADIDGNVTAWADQSGNGRDLTLGNSAVSGATSPLYNATGANGLPTIVFNSGTASLAAPTTLLSGTGDFNFFSVFSFSGGGEHPLGGNYGAGGSDPGVEVYLYDNKVQVYRGNTVYSHIANPFPTQPYDTQLITEVRRVGGIVSIYINNTLFHSSDEAGGGDLSGAINSTGNWTLGTGTNYVSGNSLANPLSQAEQLVYGDSLSEADRGAVLTYLSEKYDIEIAPVPEPTVASLVAVGAMMLTGRRVRRAAR